MGNLDVTANVRACVHMRKYTRKCTIIRTRAHVFTYINKHTRKQEQRHVTSTDVYTRARARTHTLSPLLTHTEAQAARGQEKESSKEGEKTAFTSAICLQIHII